MNIPIKFLILGRGVQPHSHVGRSLETTGVEQMGGAMAERAPYKDPDLEIDERVQDLLGRMTLAEKLKQIGCIWSTSLVDGEGFDPEYAAEMLNEGIGHITRIGANTSLTPADNAAFANQIQQVLVEHSRLGIPAIVHEEAVAGFCARGATQYPQAIGLAATFAPDLVQQMADAIRAEMLAVGARQALSPVLDIARDPRWGRLEETYGEDPYLAGRMGVAYVRGLQGDDLTQAVAATAKHFLGYGLPEGGMNHAPVQLGSRQLREVFAEPFAAAIREADLRCVMNSYSSVDGLPCAGAADILQTLLRDELGFSGVVVADYYAIDLLIRHHRVAADKGAAAAMALAAGMDVELPALDCFGEPLHALIDSGEVGEELVDTAVTRLLTLKFKLGLFENPFVDTARADACFDTPENRALALELAEKSVVLLSNDGTLPLQPGCKLAVIGPTADDPRLLQGDYHYPAHAEIVYKRTDPDVAGSSPSAAGAVRESRIDGPTDDIAPAGGQAFHPGPYYVPMVTPRAGLGAFAETAYAPGCALTDSDADGAAIAEAVKTAAQADVAVVCVGGKSGLLADCTSGEFRDAADLRLTGAQERLIREVVHTGTPTVVVVIGGRAFSLDEVGRAANALLHAWLPGEEAGTAIARVLFGTANPAGRLPVSLARAAGQVPVYYNHKSGGGRSMFMGDYSDLTASPLFPFGHGLSYSEFIYEEFSCPDTVEVHGTIGVSVKVINACDRSGDEVVQLYVRDKIADVARPVQQLVGFKRLEIPAREARVVRFQLDLSQLAYFDQEMKFVVDSGEVEVMIGASSADIRARGTVMLQGERRQLQQQQIVATQVQVAEG